MAARMRELLSHSNALQQFVTENNLERRSVAKWVDTNHEYLDFPSLDDNTLRLLTLGTYQLKLTGSYIQEYLGSDCNLQLYREMEGLIRVRLQSRHVSSRSYLIWIRYDSDHIIGWYCRCKCGSRTVGTCSHVASVLWYLGQQIPLSREPGVKDWGQYLDDAAEVPEAVDSSDSEESNIEE
ncbi:hypothetical protein DPMN_157481 [Dreissena polymorpha]|uniref:SWIM-type domain-containing protein n=2 Tax=Dreissena polymorpha TaxID=45954 RepID=A0A9D4EHQ8_DREPO|nr:hypothetical protein DPMN_157351 [Dreissena polymorpha]KAH3779676.1 hypothetical protein DPMN_157481 [Dreissena polymorpha]